MPGPIPAPNQAPGQPWAIDTAALMAAIETLAEFRDQATPAPAVTRVLFTAPDMAARAWLVQRCQALGLQTATDAVGHLFARWVGSHPQAPAVATGSHIDAIPQPRAVPWRGFARPLATPATWPA